MNKAIIQIEGISPLLINRFIDTQIDSKAKKRTTSAKEMNPEDKLYLDDGKPYIPSVYFRNCLVEAGKQFKISGQGKKNYSKLLGSTIEVNPGIIHIMPGSWTVFRISAVNPMTKGRMMVSRPKFDKWRCQFEVLCNDENVELSVVKEILDHAGKYVGVGDWRPDKKGVYGKFMVTSFKM